MTKQEIKDLIAAKIAGQGNQVDSGGALAEILKAIVDSVGESQKGITFDFGSVKSIDTDDDNRIAAFISEFNTNNGTNFTDLYELEQYFANLLENNTGLWAKTSVISKIKMRLITFGEFDRDAYKELSMIFGTTSDYTGNGIVSVFISAKPNAEPDSQLLQIQIDEI